MRKILVLSMLACGVFLAGCKGSATDGEKPAKYTLFGLAELNLEDGKDYLNLEFYADGLPIPGSFARLGDDTLFFNNDGKISVSTPAITWAFDENIAITVFDTSAAFSHTALARMPGDFLIDNFSPASRVYQGGNVVLEWTLSAGASGFFVTCVQKGNDPLAQGHAEIITTGVRAATIPPDAFYKIGAGLPERVADSFYVYVIAYNPTYYTRAGADYLDTPMYDQLIFPTSIAGADIAGTFAAAVISQREDFEVVAQE